MRELFKARLAPFRHRNFRNFFLAQSLSLVGTWSHDLARSWIVVEATQSSGALGNLNMAIAVPCLFLILQGGVLVDRADVRRLMKYTKSLLGISGLVLAALTEFTHLQVWELLIFALIEGVITAYDSPAFQALVVRMVPRQDFQQAIAVNSTNFHMSRMLGPIVAAWLMTMHGPSIVFLFDALTYFGVALVLSRIKDIPGPPPRANPARGPAMMEGLRYMWEHASLRFRILQLLLTISCVQPLMYAVFRVYVTRKFQLDAKSFGEVFSFPALGSMCGALSFAVFKPRAPIRVLIFGVPLVFVTLLTVPFMATLGLTVAAMSLTGFATYLTFASLTVSMQLDVEEEYRGRLSSVIGLGFASLGPLMSFPCGHLADWAGPQHAIVGAALVFGAGSAYLAFSSSNTSRKIQGHNQTGALDCPVSPRHDPHPEKSPDEKECSS
jgi:MFS family permease